MAEETDASESARVRLLELLESDDYRFSKRAKVEGQVALSWLHGREPTEQEMADYVIELLKSKTTLRSAPQGDPPGSTGIAWQMTDAKNVFVKLKIEGGFGQEVRQERAYVISIHESVHRK